MAKFKMIKGLGMLLLGVWLIMTGLIPLLNINVSGLPVIMQVLAVAAGFLILLRR